MSNLMSNLEAFQETLRTLGKIRTHQMADFAGRVDADTGMVVQSGSNTAGGRKKMTPMELALLTESVVIPIGLMSYIGTELASSSTGYGAMAGRMNDDEVLREFWIDYLRSTGAKGKDALIELFEKTYDELIKALGEEVRQFDKRIPKVRGDSIFDLGKYGTFDNFDLSIWRLTALLDIDDLLFMANSRIYVDRTPEQENRHRELVQLVNTYLDLLKISRFATRPDIGGWFGTFTDSMALPDIFSDDDSYQGEDVVENPDFQTTMLATTRAVLAGLFVIRSVYGEADKPELKGLREKFGKFFNNTIDHKGIMKMSIEVLEKLSDLDLDDKTGPAELDSLIHCGAIICFCASQGDKKGYDESLKKWLGIVTRLRDDIAGLDAPNGKCKWYMEPTFFACSTEWKKFAEKGQARFSAEELVEMGDGNQAFPYVLGLPLIVKSLAHFTFEIRFDRLKSCHSNEWKDFEPKAPLREPVRSAEALLDHFVPEMQKQLRSDGNGGMFGVSVEDGREVYDLSVTAGIVDALSLYAANLVCRAALAREFDLSDSDGDLTKEERQIVGNFFRLLKAQTTTTSAQIADDIFLGDDESLMDKAWLRVFVRLMRRLTEVERSTSSYADIYTALQVVSMVTKNGVKDLSGFAGEFVGAITSGSDDGTVYTTLSDAAAKRRREEKPDAAKALDMVLSGGKGKGEGN